MRLAIRAALAIAVAASAGAQERGRDGARDFDWEIGAWSTSLRYLANPLSPAPDRWVDYAGISNVVAVMSGQANLVELDVAGAAGRIRGVSLRLYEPRTRQWTLNFAGMGDGRLTPPMRGGFDARGRGLFFGEDEVDGRKVRVRFAIEPRGRDTARFVQSFSADDGATWEDNWIATDRRLPRRRGR